MARRTGVPARTTRARAGRRARRAARRGGSGRRRGRAAGPGPWRHDSASPPGPDATPLTRSVAAASAYLAQRCSGLGDVARATALDLSAAASAGDALDQARGAAGAPPAARPPRPPPARVAGAGRLVAAIGPAAPRLDDAGLSAAS